MTIYSLDVLLSQFGRNQSVVPCPALTVASWSAYRFLRRQLTWSGIPISLRIFHSLLLRGLDKEHSTALILTFQHFNSILSVLRSLLEPKQGLLWLDFFVLNSYHQMVHTFSIDVMFEFKKYRIST